MLVCQDSAVNELLHLVDVDVQSSQCVHGCVLPVADDAKEKVVRCDAVTACSHGLFAGKVYYRVEFVRYVYFHAFLICFPGATK